MQTTTATEWTVVGTWTEDGEVRCEILADGFATESEAEDGLAEVAENMGMYFAREQGGTLEVATRQDAEMVVSE